MNRIEYLIAACNAEAWRRLVWRIGLFNVCIFPEAHERPEQYDLNFIEGMAHYWDEVNGHWEWVPIKDAVKDAELFVPEMRFQLPVGGYPGLESAVETSVGRYVLNWIVIYYAFEKRMPYLETGHPMDIRKEMYSRCVDYEEDDPENVGAIRPSMVDRFVNGLAELAPLAKAIAPTGTLRSWTVHPDTYKIRDALLEKHKDELDNPAVIVKIEQALDELDREWLSGDQSVQYYSSKKSRMRRRKLMLMYGIESAFQEGADFTLIPNALVEVDKEGLKNLVAKYNSIRDGSFSRGAETAKGGEQVRIIQMIFQNHKIVEGDCGTKLVHQVFITELNVKRYLGMNAMVNGRLTPITDGFLKANLGKIINLRRPILCQMGHVDCCAACASNEKAKEPRAIAADISTAFSNVMGVAMAKMHGSDTVVVEFKPKLHIT
ncbi:putative DNA-directed RNA polymerase beta subunit [Erwinia phage vB_EamM_Huxley]|uniref:Putative DNA-directed RNA polymerase beta subunit n=1 Tax=Erwinia phage vB_EamM_Huxley TaxID=1883373 RepID=A0A1B2ID11_9CAUD|nr:RNA polymerase beta subunit [Erwinia phage vB_EamM_Huxley]ANZ49141.1 putative DNA-directed RNA polymerase beta subunit [Erwinia phage vB_EamM_Huxley]